MPNYIRSAFVEEPIVTIREGKKGQPQTLTKGGEYARGTVVPSANPSDTDVIILNGIYVQFTTGASDGTAAGTVGDPLLVNIKGSATLTVDELVSVLNGTANASIAVATYSNVSSGTFTIIKDALGDGSSYTIDTSGLTAAPTSADTSLGGGQSAVAVSNKTDSISIEITDSNDQYFTLANGVEFQTKTIVLATKSGAGNAVITVASLDGSANQDVTLSAVGQYLFYQFLDGYWRSIADPSVTAINSLATTDGNFIVGNGTTWVAESGNTVLASIGTTSTTTELNYLDLTTGPGTQEASKAVVADANVNTGVSKVTELHIGASGSEVQVNASAAEINRAADVSTRLQSVTTTPVTVDEATQEGRTIVLNKADGSTLTLPAATGSGAKYTFVVGTSVTSNAYVIQVADGSTVMDGIIFAADDTATPAPLVWVTAADSDTVTLDGSTQGGIIGDRIEFQDIAANQWMVHGFVKQSGAEATPFSAGVA